MRAGFSACSSKVIRQTHLYVLVNAFIRAGAVPALKNGYSQRYVPVTVTPSEPAANPDL